MSIGDDLGKVNARSLAGPIRVAAVWLERMCSATVVWLPSALPRRWAAMRSRQQKHLHVEQ
jgi:hypothetical protein